MIADAKNKYNTGVIFILLTIVIIIFLSIIITVFINLFQNKVLKEVINIIYYREC
jgi:ABC-type Na+ efflux pump permease subunit